MGPSMDNFGEDVRLYEPHAAAGGAGTVASQTARIAAPSSPRSHIRNQSALLVGKV